MGSILGSPYFGKPPYELVSSRVKGFSYRVIGSRVVGLYCLELQGYRV